MGNIIGVALNKVNEGLSWLVSLISQWVNTSFNTLKEAFAWVISRIKKFFCYLSNWINNSLNHIRSFFDNFSEKFKEALLKSKKMIGRKIWGVTKIMSSIGSWFQCSSQKLTLKLKNLVTSLIGNLIDLLSHVKDYINMASEAEIKTGMQLKISTSGNDEQKTLLEIGNILSNLQKACLSLLAAFSVPEELCEENGGSTLQEFNEEKLDGFSDDDFDFLADETEGKRD